MKYVRLLLIFALCGALFTPMSGEAATSSYITTQQVELKQKRSAKSKTLISISDATSVSFVKRYGSWTHIKYRGKSGYVASSAVVRMPSKKQVLYTIDTIDLREKRVTNSKKKLTLQIDTPVTVIKSFGSWTQVMTGRQTGYVPSKFLSPLLPLKPFPSLTMRPGNEIFSVTSKAVSVWSDRPRLFELEDRYVGTSTLLYHSKDLKGAVVYLGFSKNKQVLQDVQYSYIDWIREDTYSLKQKTIQNTSHVMQVTADAIFGKGTKASEAYMALLTREREAFLAYREAERIHGWNVVHEKHFTERIGTTTVHVHVLFNNISLTFSE